MNDDILPEHMILISCDCYTWVMALGSSGGRCGRCEVKPHTHVPHEHERELYARPLPGYRPFRVEPYRGE